MKVCLGVSENNGDHLLSDAGSIGDPRRKKNEPRPLSRTVFKNQFQIMWSLNKKGKTKKLLEGNLG